MEVIITFRFENAGEAEVFVEALRTYPAADKASIERIREIVLVRAINRDAARDVLSAAGKTFDVPASGRYPWGKTKEE